MTLRNQSIQRLSESADSPFDVIVIGGGINGAVATAALAGKGAKVALVDKGDFAGFTSQHSSNLAWGGIKYMENYEFRLVRQLCLSRNQLMRSFPSSVREIRFLTTIRKGFRHHPIVLWLGAWAYWLIGNGYTQTPRLLSPAKIKREECAIDVSASSGGLEYSDAYLFDNDARFVFGFVRSALDNGAACANYAEVLSAERDADRLWRVRVRDVTNGREFSVRAKALVNAAGPYVDRLNQASGVTTEHHHAFSKGIHLIVDRITPSGRVLAFFAQDGRLFFVIPMGNKTCIGTTDTRVDDPETEVTDADRQFVLDNISACLDLAKPLTRADIIAERCGVRPLALKGGGSGDRDWLQLSRKHAVDVDRERAHISIFGGKLTDCINVGEEICEHVTELGITLPAQAANVQWYGEPADREKQQFLEQARALRIDSYTVATAQEPLSERLWRRYGARAVTLLEQIRQDPTQAEPAIDGLEFIRAELALSAEREMIVTLDDFLRRRSKAALLLSKTQLRDAAGMLEACEVLFGKAQARQKFDEYFQTNNVNNTITAEAPRSAVSA